MILGTAGFTAMLCVMALEEGGVKPEDGDVLVTGASGGVGSTAVALLSALGYSVTAISGRDSNTDYLKSLGAKTVLPVANILKHRARWRNSCGPAPSTPSATNCWLACWRR